MHGPVQQCLQKWTELLWTWEQEIPLTALALCCEFALGNPREIYSGLAQGTSSGGTSCVPGCQN